MKTKYVKVQVSERLPDKAGFYFIINSASGNQIGYFNGEKFIEAFINAKYWLEPVPDHSEEMLSALSEIMRFKHELRLVMSDKLQYPDNFLKALTDAEQLINKVKDNG
ncbi:hypothetical protein BAX93_05450 [Elizabethkingia meningoseptica]|uniref:hypothetical protein n=1 Tax=Elizabethkingia meningoseptica TaxID=238 RepID=UPI00099AEDDB|nr:hypothetical protein [Elizabethkingia meningoseptica]OPC11947.1 hypothetical protein BAX93_05450 [Elizabethkingia meningoseptica]